MLTQTVRFDAEHHDDIVYPSAIPFLIVHLASLGILWSGVTWTAASPAAEKSVATRMLFQANMVTIVLRIGYARPGCHWRTLYQRCRLCVHPSFLPRPSREQ